MKKLFALLGLFLMFVSPVKLRTQTYHYCPVELSCTWVGDQVFNNVTVNGTFTYNGTNPFQLGPGGLKFYDGTVQTTAATGSGSSLFSSFQIGNNTPITTTGNYFEMFPGNGMSFQYSGNGTLSDPYVQKVNSLYTPTGTNGVVSGGYILYSGTGLIYDVSSVDYQIGGVPYSAVATPITLAASDPTYDRYDVFYANSIGSIGVITGTASVNPVIPTVDATTQVYLGTVQVTAGSSTPVGITTTDVYLENAGPPAEWTCSAGTSWTCADTVNPFVGTYDIASTGSSSTGLLTLSTATAVDATAYNVLSFALYSNSSFASTSDLWVSFYNGSNQVGTSLALQSGNYGWSGAAGSYQLVVIPLAVFSLGNNQVDSIQLKWNKNGTQTTNITIHIDNVILQQNGIINANGGGGGNGVVTGMQGDGVVYKTAVPNVSGVLQPALGSAPASYFLRGPQGSLGTNVGVRQSVVCQSTSSTITCPAFASPVAVGDKLLVIVPSSTTNTDTTTFSDSLGNTMAHAVSTGSGTVQSYGFGSITIAGTDTVAITGALEFTNFSGTHYFGAVAMELTGAASISSVASAESASSSLVSNTVAIAPSAITDALIRLMGAGSSYSSPCTATTTMSPVATPLETISSSNMTRFFGKLDIYAPGSTASTSNVSSFTQTGGTCGGGGGQQNYAGIIVDVVQDASAGSAPWVAGPIKEGDLPASAISAIQSVNKYAVPSPVSMDSGGTTTTVLSEVLTMPSDGCPCRVFIITSGVINSTSSGTWTSWVNDGTSDYATVQSITTDGHAPPLTGVGISDTYSNNQSVTFVWKGNAGIFGGAETMQFNSTAATGTSTQGSYMDLIVLQSRN
jgi:hypothetical protein